MLNETGWVLTRVLVAFKERVLRNKFRREQAVCIMALIVKLSWNLRETRTEFAHTNFIEFVRAAGQTGSS